MMLIRHRKSRDYLPTCATSHSQDFTIFWLYYLLFVFNSPAKKKKAKPLCCQNFYCFLRVNNGFTMQIFHFFIIKWCCKQQLGTL